MIRVRYLSSACVVITTPDLSLLCDPWFTDGIYDGSWFCFPVLTDPTDVIGAVDAIYVSHTHPDHYDPAFLKRYFAVHGRTPLWIAPHSPSHLARKMHADGFVPEIVSTRLLGHTRIDIIPHVAGSPSDDDSALIVSYEGDDRRHVVLNTNDIIFDQQMLRAVSDMAPAADILLCGYSGAGAYPQTYFAADDPALPAAAERKKQEFFRRYRELVDVIRPRRVIPFAGQYLLGGRLTALNSFRGLADAVEVTALDPRAVVLADGGNASIDTARLAPTATRTQAYSAADYARRFAEIRDKPFDYERWMTPEMTEALPLERLMRRALERARRFSHVDDDHFFAIGVGEDRYFAFNARKGAEDDARTLNRRGVEALTPRSEIRLDPRYLFGLLTTLFHWSNAEIGSHLSVRRTPDVYNRKAMEFLHFFSV